MYDDHPTGVSLFTFILLLSLRKQRKNNFHILSSHSLCGMHGSYNNRSSIFSIYRFCKMSYYLWIWSLLYYIFHLYCCCGRFHNRLHLLPLTRSVLHSLHPTLLPLTSSLPEPPLQILHSKIHWSVLHSVS